MYHFEMFVMLATVGLLGGLWLLHRRLASAIVHRSDPAPLQSNPSVTVIRPIKGLDADVQDNFRAALDHGYAGEVETLFVFDDDQEPALPLARDAIAEHAEKGGSGSARIVFCGQPLAGRTGKLHAMIVALRQARGEVIVFADSDIRPDREALTALVGTLLRTPKGGSAFAPVVVTPPPETVGDAGYALLLNGMYSPAAELAGKNAGYQLPFIMGQFMAFRREALEAIGGLESAEGQFVDDMYLGARVTSAGYQNVVSPHRVPIIQRGVSNAAFVGIYNRWLTFGRTGLPDWSFKLPPALQGALFWVGSLLSVAALASGAPLIAALAALVPLLVAGSMVTLHAELGGASPRPRLLVGALWVMVLAPVLFVGVYFRSEIEWRGRAYQLGGDSRLAEHGKSELREDRQAA